MTANEQHLLTIEACVGEMMRTLELLRESQTILKNTEPPRRDSVGPDIGRLNLRMYGQASQAREAALMLLSLLKRQRGSAES